ncbi:hypothetical protein [Legionella fallonii]|uniref:Uncharacterized protein n=1 Tax=Legionella fallonii LLAP-10 TaxID=1212491 RepID=A0A098GA06_9GAMM|nr:hypothetical protein [Legionella fallonii]CEG59314.1 protein of unknown function [Legionella fallonii LLAP-10]
MNYSDRKYWHEGKALWLEYINQNGYSSSFTIKGMNKLSKNLDLKPAYVRKCLSIYLEN